MTAVVAALVLTPACVTPYAAATPVARPAADGDEVVHTEPELLPSRHRIQPGENLYRISLKYGVGVDALMRENGITDVRTLKVGQELSIPGGTPEPPKPAPAVGRGLEAPKAPPAPPAPERKEPDAPVPRHGRSLPSRESFGRGDLHWPLRGVLYGRFGKRGREPHDGIDLAAPLGTSVKTAAPGTVLFAGEQRGYGLIVVIDHGDGVVTLYAYNHSLRVRTGQRVRQGQVVATVGQSDRTSGPHLHFEVRVHGRPVDPLPRLGPPPRNEP